MESEESVDCGCKNGAFGSLTAIGEVTKLSELVSLDDAKVASARFIGGTARFPSTITVSVENVVANGALPCPDIVAKLSLYDVLDGYRNAPIVVGDIPEVCRTTNVVGAHVDESYN